MNTRTLSEDVRSIYDAAYERGYRFGYEQQAAFMAEWADDERQHFSAARLGEHAGRLKAMEEYAQAELRRLRLVQGADR
jgi:hypothetical protein